MLVLALSVGYHLVSGGALTVGGVTAAVLMIIRLRGPINTLMRVLDVIRSGYASLARIVGVVSDPPVPVPDLGADPRGPGRTTERQLQLRRRLGRSRRQPGHRAGETVAMVGASGAGKTTVAALVAGLRVPDAGQVLVDGYPVSQLSDTERIARLATVSQEVHVFSGTLRQDLTLAKADATDAELRAALDRVHAHPGSTVCPPVSTRGRGPRTPAGAGRRTAVGPGPDPAARPAIVVMDEATAEAGSAGAEALEDGSHHRWIGAGRGPPPRPGLAGRHHPGHGRRGDRRTRHPRPAARRPGSTAPRTAWSAGRRELDADRS